MKITLKNNLRLGLGLSLIILFISSLASYISISRLIQSADLVKGSDEVILDIQHSLLKMIDAETGQRSYLLTGNKIFLEPYLGARDSVNLILAKIAHDTNENPVQRNYIGIIKSVFNKRLDFLKIGIDLKVVNKNVDEVTLLKGKEYMDEGRLLVKKMSNEERRLLNSRTQELNKLTTYTPILIVMASILAIIITLFFYHKVSVDFDDRVRLQREIEGQKAEVENRLVAIKDIAYQISKGDYDMRLDNQTQDDIGELSGSLNDMAKALKRSFNALTEKEWIQAGVAGLNVRMVGDKNIFELAEDIIYFLATYTNAQIGVLYMFEGDGLLHLKGQYAALSKKLPETLELGEGLIGQSVKTSEVILVKDVPQNEFTISYATGAIRPAEILVIPIIRNEISVGGIQLGTTGSFTSVEIELLKSVMSDVGTALIGAQNRQQLQSLLEETQAQSEELQVQHVELEGMNAELEAQTQKLQASEEELKVQQEELLQANQELEERSSLLEERNEMINERNIEIQHKAEALEVGTKYKSEFMANMSHELRTPLNSILLLSRLMSESEQMDKEHQEFASVIQSSGQGLLSLIDEILDLSKIEAGKMELEKADIATEEIVTTMRALFKPVATEKKLDFLIETDPDVPRIFNSDKMRLEQILKNLLSNAIKFTAKGSVKLKLEKNNALNALIFTVSDTGLGIPTDKQGLIFEAFQQADGSTRRKFGGTGLGLSISRELARLLGGYIELSSEEDKGSRFSLTLPLADFVVLEGGAETPVEVKEEVVKPRVKQLTTSVIPPDVDDDRDNIIDGDKVILIVEDDTAFAKILLKFAREKDYKGLVAVRGDVGVELAQAFLPKAILLDIQLPIKDGWQVMEELKADPKTRPIPVHIMSSLHVRKESLLKGAVEFINKPFAFEHMQEMFNKLEDALNGTVKKVLIVEENEQHAKALSYYLSNFNIQTELVRDVKDSVKALGKPDVNCVILDMGVPDKLAYETLEVIKKNPGLENLPIIIFTGKNLSKGEEKRIKQYADSIVVKTAHSYQRILDEAGLFLHLVEERGTDKVIKSKRFGELQDVLAGKTVLIADDDVRNIFSLSKILEQHKMHVLTAIDGKEALKLLNDNVDKVDVVLMDMMMPEMDGYETTKRIREDVRYKNLPILAVTAKAMMGDREKCIAAGASDYISKPVDMDQLSSLLRVWLYENRSKNKHS
ncbi:MAG: response regulator [Pedobacter sp.]|nr:response regulator [Pedobacter sp.]